VTLAEFERAILDIALASPICGIPLVRRLTPTAINLRVEVTTDGFIDAFYNEQTDTIVYALIQDDQRVFGADNTGGWHIHPFDNPADHQPLPGKMSFADVTVQVSLRGAFFATKQSPSHMNVGDCFAKNRLAMTNAGNICCG